MEVQRVTMKPGDLEDRLINFAVRVLNVTESLPNTKAGSHIAGQLVRSGTSPAPNYGEAQSAESRRDFVHKMKICLKELRGTQIWLRIIERKPMCEANRLEGIIKQCDELVAIFVSSVKTAEEKEKQ